MDRNKSHTSNRKRPALNRLINPPTSARVFIADINLPGATAFTADLNALHPNSAFCDHCDVNSWSDLTSCLLRALELFDGRIDYIFPIAGLTERQVIPKPSEQRDVRREGFVKPDLTVLETNATGMVNLVLAAVQVFRGQEPREELGAMRGKSEYLKAVLLEWGVC